MFGMPSVTVEELKKKLDAKEELVILDVREPSEVAVAALPGSTRIPLGTLPALLGELPKDREIVVHCKMGGRSAQAVQLLRRAGFPKVFNLTGGIDAWADRIDRSMKRY
jgi:adenylyltransferase/sulfurtransferase